VFINNNPTLRVENFTKQKMNVVFHKTKDGAHGNCGNREKYATFS
jgi:hypothetical protein